MANSDLEIEFLDEDAAIVQQCVQTDVQADSKFQLELLQKKSPLLVERQSKYRSKRKKPKHEDDEDYDPSKDENFYNRKRKATSTPKVIKPIKNIKIVKEPPKQGIVKPRIKYIGVKSFQEDKYKNSQEVLKSKKPTCIPDYVDPICLPVVAKSGENISKLKTWNKACVDMYGRREEPMLSHSDSEKNKIKSSKRTIVIRKVQNKITAQTHTSVFHKVAIESTLGETNSEVFQTVLPKFEDRKQLKYKMYEPTRLSGRVAVNTVILSQEDYKNVQALVVYKPERAQSSIYYLKDKSDKEDDVSNDDVSSDDVTSRHLEEVFNCKVCAPCFQYSWRGTTNLPDKKEMHCDICGRSYVNTYNLLTHLKTHDVADIKKYRKRISSTLAKFVGYHYKCRICQMNFLSIKELRQHIIKHQGKTLFNCVVGNHMTS